MGVRVLLKSADSTAFWVHVAGSVATLAPECSLPLPKEALPATLCVTHRVRLECDPDIPVAPGEEHYVLDPSLDEDSLP